MEPTNLKEQLLQEINQTPTPILKEVLDFLLFVRSKEMQREELKISLLSEPIIAEEWLTPEEDKAWQQL
jgi:hypothetical protein